MISEQPSFGFAPVIHRHVHTLVLGSLPSRRSIETGQYYGHPRNAFWPLLGALLGFDPGIPYPQRTEALLQADIGLWDVLQSSRRSGSLDANIDMKTARANDFERLLADHPALMRFCFNGKKAAEMFRRLRCLSDEAMLNRVTLLELPSTSPAHAAMSFADKLDRWSVVIEPAEPVL